MKQDQIDGAILAHKNWITRFECAIAGLNGDPFNPSQIADDTLCELGTWMGSQSGLFSSLTSHRHIMELHRTFHHQASTLAQQIKTNAERNEIDISLDRLHQLSDALIDALETEKGTS